MGLKQLCRLIMTGKQRRRVNDQRQPARTRAEGLTHLNFNAPGFVLRDLIVRR